MILLLYYFFLKKEYLGNFEIMKNHLTIKRKYLDISQYQNRLYTDEKNARTFNFQVISNGVEEEPRLSMSTLKKDNFLTQILVKLTPYKWTTPFGLEKKEIDIYWNQPENHRNFKTARYYKIEDVYGLVEIYNSSKLKDIYQCGGNVTHYINYENAVIPSQNPKYDVAVVLPPCYDVPYFQHFLDNGVPQLSLMRFASNFDPSKTVICLQSWNTPMIPYLLNRYGFMKVVSNEMDISAKTLIIPRVSPMVHPILSKDFVDKLKLNHSMPADLVILVSRGSEDGTKSSRIIINQNELEELLRNEYKKEFVVFHPSMANPEEAIRLFQRAKIIIGSHGGGLYNAFWAREGIAVVEIMPETEDGRYYGQPDFQSGTGIAHRCFHTNSRNLQQYFFRYVAYTNSDNYKINATDFMIWLKASLSFFYNEIEQQNYLSRN